MSEAYNQIVTVGDQRIAVGMTWASIGDPKQIRKELFELAAQVNSASPKNSIGAKTTTLGGVLPNLTKAALKGKAKLHSGALAFALANASLENAILVLDLNDDWSWFVALRNGQIDISTDVVERGHNIADRVRDYKLGIHDVDFQVYGQTDKLRVDQEYSFDHLALNCSKASLMEIIKPVGESNTRLAVLVLAALALGGWTYKGYLDDQKAAEAKKLAAAQQVDPVQAYQASLPEAAKLTGAPASYVSGVLAKMDSFPVSLGGWTIDAITCGIHVETPGDVTPSCELKWKSETGSSFKDFVAAYGEKPKSAMFAADATRLAYSAELPVVKANERVDISKAPTMESVIYDFGSDMQNASKLGTKFRLGELSVYGAPSTIEPNQVPSNIAVKRGDWSIETTYVQRELLAKLPTNFTVTEIQVQPMDATTTKLTAKGYYYVKN